MAKKKGRFDGMDILDLIITFGFFGLAIIGIYYMVVSDWLHGVMVWTISLIGARQIIEHNLQKGRKHTSKVSL